MAGGGRDGQSGVHPRADPKHNKQNVGEEKDGEMEEEGRGEGCSVVACTGRTMTIPPDCSAVHMLMMGAMPMVVPWKYTPLE